MATIQSVVLKDGRVNVDIGGDTMLVVTLDAAQQVARQLAEVESGEAVTIKVGAVVHATLDGEQRDALLARITRLSSHLDQFSE